jgi:hypothetical protein
LGSSKPEQPECQRGCNVINIRPTPQSYGSFGLRHYRLQRVTGLLAPLGDDPAVSFPAIAT